MFTELAPGVHALLGAVNSLIVEDGQGGALLVDTGLDDTHARKLLRGLQELALRPTAILNTHSHADHHGGNTHLLKHWPDLPVYAPPLEAAIIRHPILEPLTLYGASPPPELRGKFLLAPVSPAQEVGSGNQVLGGVAAQLLPVPGHAAQMYAVKVGSVLYAADALFGPQALARHPLTFCVDSAAQKASAAGLADLLGTDLGGVQTVLPGHGDPTPNLAALAQANLAAYAATTAAVLSTVTAGAGSVDDLLVGVCQRLGLQMTHAGAVVLNRAVVSAHLTELRGAGQVALEVRANRLVFRAGA